MDAEAWYGAAYKGSKDFTQLEVPTANATGFGAAADDFMERGIDLNEQLIHNKPATYFFRMNSEAMQEAGIYAGDVLIVDRSLPAVHGKIVVAVWNGEMLVRRLWVSGEKIVLSAGNKRFANIPITPDGDYSIWGVVVYTIHSVYHAGNC